MCVILGCIHQPLNAEQTEGRYGDHYHRHLIGSKGASPTHSLRVIYWERKHFVAHHQVLIFTETSAAARIGLHVNAAQVPDVVDK